MTARERAAARDRVARARLAADPVEKLRNRRRSPELVPPKAHAALTLHERGLTETQVADELRLAPNTVRGYLTLARQARASSPSGVSLMNGRAC